LTTIEHDKMDRGLAQLLISSDPWRTGSDPGWTLFQQVRSNYAAVV
jgi:hypothetical protein